VNWKIVVIVRFIVDSQFATGSFASAFTTYAAIIDCVTLYNLSNDILMR
jgi:hypothetical protein